jgi:FAD/FMN-containing dehydrogenase
MTISDARLSIPRLRSELLGEVLAPGDDGYEEARSVFSRTVDRRPAVIVRPDGADEVARVVALARETGLELAVRSGGHSSAGHGVSEGGIVLDLARLKALELDPANRVAWAETGLTAGEVTSAAGAYGLAASFGDAPSVGIGGLTLGGGIGYLVRKYGMTVDQLLAAEIVTADGRLLHVDEETYPDLFWAIRGGGGNFGVATRFRYRLLPVDTVIGGMLMLPATVETITAFVAAAESAPEELSAIGNVVPAPPLPFVPESQHGKPVIIVMLVHSGGGEAGERAVAAFRSIAPPVVDALRTMPFPEIYPQEEGMRPLAAVRSLFLDSVGEREAREILGRLERSSAQIVAAQLRVLGGAMARVPAEATAFAHRSSKVMVNVAAIYSDLGEAPLHEAWVTEFAAELRQQDTGVYVNFLGDEGDDRIHAAYPEATWDRLAAVKRRYDPDNLFRLNQNIPPAADQPKEAAA